MAKSKTTLRRVFSIPEEDAQNASPDDWKTFQETLAEELKGIKCPVPMSQLAPKICELFDVEIPSLLLSSWEKAEDLQTVLEESRKEPGAVKYLELAEHSIDREHHPYLEVKIKKACVKKIQFSIRLSLKLKGFVLKIQDGQITEMITGQCEAAGTVKYEKLTILEKKLAPIDLPGSISLTSEKRKPQEKAAVTK